MSIPHHSNTIPLNQLTPRATDLRWRDYPAGIGGHNAITTPGKSLSDRLSGLSEILFSDDIDLRIIDIRSNNDVTTCNQKPYKQATEVESVLLQDDKELPRIRIISLHSTKSPLALEITETLMRKVLTRFEVDPAFLSVLFSFGEMPHLAESGSSNIASTITTDGSRKISYQIRYAEENHRSPERPWSVRQTGVYHHHSVQSNFDLFILLHPIENSLFEQQVTSLAMTQSSQAELASLVENPYRMHLMPFALYLDNWRWYFRYLGEEFQKKNDEVMTVDIKTSAAVSLNFDKVQGLRDLEDTALSLSAYCKAGSGIIEALHDVPGADYQGVWSLNPFDARLRGYGENISVLTKRIGNTIELFAYALDLKNQYTAADINNHVSQLTEKTSELAEKTTHDTTAVKWITYLTLVYLPGSFVAGLYGMNLFVFNPQSRRLVIAEDFWICVVTWFLLTVLTFLGYGALVIRNRPRGENGWHWLKTLKVKGLKDP